jgi:hypothetical protein
MLRGLLLLGAALVIVPAAAAKEVFVTFQTPSHNIGCVYVHPGTAGQRRYLRCNINSGLQPRPPKPKGCTLDWGGGLEMGARTKPLVSCAGDTVYNPKARVLAYGHRWSRDGFSCTSAAAGLTCRNPAGHGFFLSRQSWRTF